MPQRKQQRRIQADAGGTLRRSGVRASGRAKGVWFDETMAVTPTDEHDQGWITEMGDAPVAANHKLPRPLSRFDPVQFRTQGKTSRGAQRAHRVSTGGLSAPCALRGERYSATWFSVDPLREHGGEWIASLFLMLPRPRP